MENKGIYWKKNIDVLNKKYPDIAANLKLHNDHIFVNCFESKSGHMTAKAKDMETGREVLLHSPEDPISETENIVDGLELKGGELRCLIGIGLGYLAIEILKRNLPLHKLLIIEGSFSIFSAAMSHVDLTEVLNSDSVTLYVGKEFNFNNILNINRVAINMHGLPITIFEPARQIMPEFYTNVIYKLKEEGNSILGVIVTAKNIGLTSFQNILDNCTEIINSANISSLEASMKGRPAVVIGAGPYLSEAIPVLKKWGHMALLVCVDSALPILLKEGIKPDIVATVDYSFACVEKFRDIIDKLSDIPMCYIEAVNPLTVKLYPCPTKFFLAEGRGFLASIKRFWGKWARLPAMQGVAHMAYSVAAETGASPIILLGFDLAYTGFKSHASGMALPVTINLENAAWIETLEGEMAPTMFQMLGMKSGIEHLIRFYNSTPCLNANKTGARIVGAPQCDLEEILSKTEPPQIFASEIIKGCFEKASKPSSQDILPILNENLIIIYDLISQCRKTVKNAEKALKKIAKDKAIISGIPEISTLNALRNVLDGYEETIKNIAFADIHEIIHILEGLDLDLQTDEVKLNVNDQELKAKDKVSSEMNMVIKSMSIRIDALKKIESYFKKIHERLNSEIELKKSIEKELNTKKRADLLIRLGKVYLNYGDTLPAEKVLRQSIDLDKNNADSYVLLSKSLSIQLKHKDALQYITYAKKLSPARNDIKKIFEQESTWPDRKLNEAAQFITLAGAGYTRLPWAVRIISEVLKLYPNHARAKIYFSEVNRLMDESKKRLNLIAELIDGDEQKVIERIDELTAKEDFNLAISVANILVKKYPKSAIAKERLALLILDKGMKAEAKKLLIQAISLNPNRPDTMVHLGMIFAEEGDLQEARNYLLAALNLDSNLTILHEALGDLNYALKQYEASIENYENFFLANPNRKDILNRMGDCYFKIGKQEAAQAAWQAGSTNKNRLSEATKV
ncbi:MAG: DUF115 domain-containing protein [Desulfobacterales bacterium]|nr:DUF115 domain-containing protein [Desulfobacterales bacterium]